MSVGVGRRCANPECRCFLRSTNMEALCAPCFAKLPAAARQGGLRLYADLPVITDDDVARHMPATVQEIAAALGRSKSTITSKLMRMARRGVARRREGTRPLVWERT